MTENERTSDIIDTTDCLEAISAFKAMKNLLFVISLICLLILQLTFWINHLGYIDKDDCAAAGGTAAQEKCDTKTPSVQQAGDQCAGGVMTLAAVTKDEPTDEPEETEITTNQDRIRARAKEATKELAPPETPAVDTPTADTTAEADEEETEVERSEIPIYRDPDPSDTGKSLLKCRHISCVIRACNSILIISATLYSLTLLISLKISLIGRLGGINHISRAFFLSLFVLVILLPWQQCFPGMIVGAMFTPDELLCGWNMTADTSILEQIFYHLRFIGMWLLVLLLLIFAQRRSIKWSTATLKRLGILH
ncbi:MAG: hypothetical protein KAT00_06615 [Planctomycetes bacterium]|nr:hypothetical protein [Planctomycetota bacterium]